MGRQATLLPLRYSCKLSKLGTARGRRQQERLGERPRVGTGDGTEIKRWEGKG